VAKVMVNGRAQEVTAGSTLGELLARMQLRPENVVAAVNGEVVATDAVDVRVLRDGDALDVMSFVGGG